jgi:cobalt/nickel transport system permease protein
VEKAVQGESPVFFLENVDPRLKVVALVVWSVVLAILHTMDAALIGFAGSMLLAIFSGVLFSFQSLKKVLAVNVFLIFIWLFLPFSFKGGEVVHRMLGLSVTREGLDLSALVSVKALSITLGAASILGSTSIYTILCGLKGLGCPEKVIALLLLMSRYIQVVGDEYKRLRNAMRIRGFTPKLSMHTLKSVANLCGMLLVRGFERGDRVLAAMLCRGYKGRLWVGCSLKFNYMDLAFALIMAGLVVVVEIADAS